MATLYVRNFPDQLYASVQELAKDADISLRAEVIELVTDAVARQQQLRRRREAMARIKSRYDRFHAPTDGKDTLAMLREDRER
ncbi:MAG TPA: hypothetical protein PKZ39_00215 [Clostridia bacterium]|nr:hypothetical protein [Armatimonadota bacterium]HOQ62377.1 hypothetical protein [Clostridia bacterium]